MDQRLFFNGFFLVLHSLFHPTLLVCPTDKRKLQITGDTTVEEENVLNMTCSIESFPPALIVWKKISRNTNLHSGTYLYNDTGSATLTIPNVTAQHSGQYICTVKHLNTTVTSYVSVTVTCK